ncbi:MAG: hypothetical protein JXM70_21295 [Pirellulales bacterium]|nr:hypothetical protein [Pirellulales bacterium]
MPRMQSSNESSVLSRVALLAAAVLITSQACAAEKNSATEQKSTTQRIDKLIAELGNEDYHIRHSAQLQLANIGFDAFDALSAAENHEDPEVAGRARYLLRLLQVNFADKNDSPKVKEILEDYLSKSASEKLMVMRTLAALPQGEGLPALCRLVRFQRSELLSKQAATAILKWQIDNPTMTDRLEPLFKSRLGASRRPSALWLQNALLFATDPNSAVKHLREFIARENDLLLLRDPRTNNEVVKSLINYDIHWSFALKRSNKEKVDAFKRLVSLRRTNIEALYQLIPWLVEKEAWKAMGKNPAEFTEHFAVNPRGLLYALAQTFQKQGKTEQAEEAAVRALRLDYYTRGKPENVHFQMAFDLQRLGQFEWARREYQYCIDSGDPENELILLAYSYLAEMLHDQAKDTQAAAVLKKLIDNLKAAKDREKEEKGAQNVNKLKRKMAGFPEMKIESLEARRGFFLSEQHRAKGQSDKQRECLEAALAADPGEIDVLIACYRLKDSTPEFRQKIKKLIREASDRMHMLAIKNPHETSWLNQYAWLVSNTEGDLDEALRFSQKSLQLNQDNGGYYDTLARCYYAKGDLESAVKTQTRAAQLEPHSGLIARQLELFKKALADKKK